MLCRNWAAAPVFDKLIEKTSKEINLPPSLERSHLDALPEDTGVYFFYDAKGRLLYVGKSINIRDRVKGHFLNDLNSSSRRPQEKRYLRNSL